MTGSDRAAGAPGRLTPFTGILDGLAAVAERRDPSVRDLVEAFGDRGFGALMLVPAILVILPVGMLPFVPAISAALLLLIGFQMFFGTARLWLPGRLARVKVPGDRLAAALPRARPVAIWLDRRMQRRFAWFARSRVATRTIAAVNVVAAAAIFAVGYIPGLPALVCLPVIAFALGLVAQNGLVVLVGFGLAAVPVAAWVWVF